MKLLDNIAEEIVDATEEIQDVGAAYRKKKGYSFSVFILLSQMILFVFLIIHNTNSNYNDFLQVTLSSFAASTTISLLLLLDFSCLYKSYYHRQSSFWKLFLIQGVIIFALVYFYGIENIADFFTTISSLPYLKIVLCVLGMIEIIVSVLSIATKENKKSPKTKKSTDKKESFSDNITTTSICKKLLRKIRDNSITICFLNSQWGFERGEHLKFGFDSNAGCFVFVNEKNYNIIDCKTFVFLDFEDEILDRKKGTGGMIAGAIVGGYYLGLLGAVIGGAGGRLDAQTVKVNRLIKFYYLNQSGKENTISFAQIFPQEYIRKGGEIEKIKEFCDSIRNKKHEIIFKRKIRHKASTLDKEVYGYKPFFNDNWFFELEKYMSEMKNDRTDGFSLFKKYVIYEKNYLDDETIENIVVGMSSMTPNKAQIQREAKSLCRKDSVSAMASNLKQKVKKAFQKNT